MQAELYTSAQGLVARQLELDAVANNIANVNTTGFRRTSPFFQTFNKALEDGPQNPLNAAANNQPVLAGTFTHSEQGPIRQTENPLDLAIEGEGFFKVDAQAIGGTRYTRAGAFQLNENGVIVNQNGYPLLDTQNRPITLNRNDGEVNITKDGEVYQNGALVSTIALVSFDNTEGLTPEADTLFAQLDPGAQEQLINTPRGSILQGALEGSNVNIAEEMINMIVAQRAYEANVRGIRTIDNNLNQGVLQTYR